MDGTGELSFRTGSGIAGGMVAAGRMKPGVVKRRLYPAP